MRHYSSNDKKIFASPGLDLSSDLGYHLFYQPAIGETSCFYPFAATLPFSYWLYAGLTLSEKQDDQS
ncbi:MAG: hypothetical protein V4487_09060 [Chlamydiota bacterium]